ncbi:MAG: alpha/beta hydrolase [Chloroflexi bacterium]|nr:alpha/beta hydrolase [Chloroflexota bacterium]
MPLDPQARAYLDQMAAAGYKPAHQMTVAEARESALARKRAFGGVPPAVATVEERIVPVEGGEIPVTAFVPDAARPLPILVYYHGGGWVTGSIETHANACRALARQTPCVVVSVEYRCAPEAKFPRPLEDCYAATRWVAEHAEEFGGDASRLAVGGDSAGGNLAAAVCLLARERGGPSIAYQLLIYPVTDHNFETASYRDMAHGYMLTRESMRWFWDHYLPSPDEVANPLASVLRADLHGLPPAYVITAECDPLRDEGDAYAERLKEAGVHVQHLRYPGMLHGFFNVGTPVQMGDVAVARAAEALHAALAG